jgi:hypothetical protein
VRRATTTYAPSDSRDRLVPGVLTAVVRPKRLKQAAEQFNDKSCDGPDQRVIERPT